MFKAPLGNIPRTTSYFSVIGTMKGLVFSFSHPVDQFATNEHQTYKMHRHIYTKIGLNCLDGFFRENTFNGRTDGRTDVNAE